MNLRSLLSPLSLIGVPRSKVLLPLVRDAQLDAGADLARRALRATLQSEAETARELCAEPDAALAVLAAAFENQPTPITPRSWVLLTQLAFGFFALGVPCLASGAQFVATMALGASALMVVGLALAQGLRAPLWRAHQHLGLMLLPLDERHPWLYLAPPLLHSELARKHKESALHERGVLRGLDLVLMREYSRLDASLAELAAPHKVVDSVQH